MEWIIDCAKTWGHILVGVGLLGMMLVACSAWVQWYKSITDQIDDERDSQGRPQPWRYQ